MIEHAREVAAGRIDLDPAADHDAAWHRLRAIPGIGAWTVEMTAIAGQGRYDQVLAGDVGLLKLVGCIATGNPHARAGVELVRALFAPYGRWAGLALAGRDVRRRHQSPCPGRNSLVRASPAFGCRLSSRLRTIHCP